MPEDKRNKPNKELQRLTSGIIHSNPLPTEKDDFWGIRLFPWKQNNLIPYLLIEFTLIELILVILGIVWMVFGDRWNFRFLVYLRTFGWIQILVVSQFIALLFVGWSYLTNIFIRKKLETKKKDISYLSKLQSDCMLLRGDGKTNIGCPAIVEYQNDNLVFTPLLANPFQIPLKGIQEVKETRFIHIINKYYSFNGNNLFFQLKLKDSKDKIGFGVSHPQKWQTLFQPITPNQISIERTNLYSRNNIVIATLTLLVLGIGFYFGYQKAISPNPAGNKVVSKPLSNTQNSNANEITLVMSLDTTTVVFEKDSLNRKLTANVKLVSTNNNPDTKKEYMVNLQLLTPSQNGRVNANIRVQENQSFSIGMGSNQSNYRFDGKVTPVDNNQVQVSLKLNNH